MSELRIVSTSAAPAAIGPYNQAVVAAGLVHCSGQIALDPASGNMVPGNVQAQATQVFANLKAVLAEAGSSIERVVKCNVYLTTMGDFAAVNEIYALQFDAARAPARATVTVAGLPKDALVEIDCVALA